MQRDAAPLPRSSPLRAPFRTPESVDRFRILHPELPRRLEGVTVLHITDLHAHRHRQRYRDMVGAVRRVEADFAALTGDFMGHPGDERLAMNILDDLRNAWSIRRGAFGVFGNHDSTTFRRALAGNAGDEPQTAGQRGIAWLDGGIHDPPDLPLRISGLSWPEDLTAFARRLDAAAPLNDRFHIALAHHPCVIPALSAAGVHLALLGHTHGGQIRLGPRLAPFTNSGLPRDMPAGIIRSGNMLACVSRGVGEGGVDLRLRCPPQIAIYELRRGPLAGEGRDVIEAIDRW